MTTVIRTLTTTCLAALLAIGLAACGGGDTKPPTPTPAEQQTKAVNDAIAAATAAVGALTNTSDAAAVAAAQTAIDAATTTLEGTDALSASAVVAFQGQIVGVQANLKTAKTAIADNATHQSQLSAANIAVDAATTAVDALTNMSSSADAAAADSLIAAAEAAVTAGTMLTAAEEATLNGKISTAKSSLATKKQQIADYGTHKGQLDAANMAVRMAETAVNGLNNMSTGRGRYGGAGLDHGGGDGCR